jgi:hypothetical protein
MKIRNKKSMHIMLKAVAEDVASGEFLAIIKFRDIDGKFRSVMLPLSDLDDIKALNKNLKDAGCYFSKKQEKSDEALIKLAKSTGRADRWKFAPRTGWYDGHRQFVRPDRVIGKPRDILVKPPRANPGNHNSALEICGSLQKWIENVAMTAQYSSRMILGICMAFAATLLDFAKLNSFGILLYGPGKVGKSTMLVVAGSGTGFGSEQDLPNFRTTDAALGEIPASFNDMLLPLNELGLLKGRTGDRSDRIRDFSYGLAEGRGTTYSKFAPHAMSNAGLKWHCLALASGEEASDQISEAAGHTRTVGAAIRWIDLCAVRKGAKDIFDLCPEEVTRKKRKAWVQQQCADLRNDCRAHHGVAIAHFIKRIIKKRKTVRLDLRVLTEAFVNDVVEERDGPAVRHLATCFGHIAAAGVLAVRFKTVPWSEGFVTKCVKRCYRDARRALRTEDDLLHEGLRVLKGGIDQSNLLKVAANRHYSPDTWKTTDGYWEKTAIGKRVTLRGDAFKGLFNDQRQPTIVLRWLHSKNALSSKHRPAPPSSMSITWAESQPQWPDGSRRRSIVIELRPEVLAEVKSSTTTT